MWLDNDEDGGIVRFTTWAKFCQAIHREVSLTDKWGNIIEKMSKDSLDASASDDEQQLAVVVPVAEAISDSEEDSAAGSVVGAPILPPSLWLGAPTAHMDHKLILLE